MSTKIYNAFRMQANSLDEVINTFFKEKKSIEKEIEKQLIKEVLLEMIECYDAFSLRGDNLPLKKNQESKEDKESINNDKTINSIIMDKIWNRNKKIDNHEEVKTLEISMIIYPQSIDCFGEKNYLMQLYAEDEIKDIIVNQFLKKWGIEEYNYWNSTDQPDTITDYEWEIRKTHWSEIDIPLLSGMSITFLKSSKYEVFYTYSGKSRKAITKTILEDLVNEFSIEKRIENNLYKVKEKISYDEIYKEFIKNNNLENAERSVLADQLISQSMKMYFAAREKTKKNNFNEEQLYEIQEKEKQIKLLLKNNFIIEDFAIEVKDIQAQSLAKINKKLKLK